MNTELQEKLRTNVNSLTVSERQRLVKSTYAKKSYFQELFGKDHVEFDCEPVSTNLRKEIDRLLIEKGIINQHVPLENLHEHISDELKAYNFNDGVNKLSTYFYENDDQFIKVFYQLIHHIRQHMVKEPFWFQATPTIRLHCPKGANSNHYPRYHTDIGYGHPPEEINLWLPLTPLLDGHGFRSMSLEDSKKTLAQFDYHFADFIDKAIHDKNFSNQCDDISPPVSTELGKIIAFDSRCVHTGEPLKTHTRASIDIRILPVSQYEDMDIEYQGTGRRKIIFAPGFCYHAKNSDEI